MKKMLVAVAAVLLVVGHALAADDVQAKRAVAEKLLNLFNMEQTYDQTMKQCIGMTTNMLASQNMTEDERKQAIASVEASTKLTLEKFSWAKMKGMFVDIYSEVLSMEELQGLVSFYESPIGQKFIAKQPELTTATMKKMQAVMQELIPEIQKQAENAKSDSKAKN